VIQIVALLLVGLLVYLALGNDVTRLVRPRVRNYQIKYRKYLTRSVIIPALVFGVLAIAMRDLVLSLYLLGIAGFIVYFRVQQAIIAEQKVTPRQVLQLVLAFRGAYQLEPAVFKSLQEVGKKLEGPLREAVNVMVETFFLTSSTQRAFDEFRKRTNNILLNQFAYILEMSESASNASMAEALDGFVTRLRHHEELQRQIETGLSSVTGQTSFMQILFIAIAFVVALVPSLRGLYVSSFGQRLLYIVIMSVIVGTSYFIEKQVIALREQVL
jgi:hypothetical protein